ncbi:MAG: TPM domain-containing protein [Candidatus Aminicenantia bacterium]
MKRLPQIAKLFAVVAILLLISCGGKEQPYDTNVSLAKGEPAFIPLGDYWVIDKVGALSRETIIKGDTICQTLQDDGIAEMVVLIQTGIKQPEKYATHYGRWLKLGKKGRSTEGGNNGIVWLIRPDAEFKMTISVGRGLPRFTSSDYGEVMEKAKEYLNFNNFDKGVLVIIEETNKKLRELYPKGGK